VYPVGREQEGLHAQGRNSGGALPVPQAPGRGTTAASSGGGPCAHDHAIAERNWGPGARWTRAAGRCRTDSVRPTCRGRGRGRANQTQHRIRRNSGADTSNGELSPCTYPSGGGEHEHGGRRGGVRHLAGGSEAEEEGGLVSCHSRRARVESPLYRSHHCNRNLHTQNSLALP
jgi:hypothetical protein